PGHQRAGPSADVGRLPQFRLRRGRGAGRHGERGAGRPPPGGADPGGGAARIGGRALFGLDAGAPVPVVEIALLRSLPLFAELPAPAIEGIAAALTPIHLPAGAVLIRQGDPGDAYYAIAAGELDVQRDGRFLCRCGRGEGVGEIALLRAIPRTATVTAHTPATVYQLNRDPFLTAVLGHAPTQRQADRIADTRLAAGAEPGRSDIPGPGAAGPG
ncbi:MAG TPA: cyclic nucleotide-binding domain-containing protein, partial [Streptosporangiaceae bacterium]|nr:cyclic nucleotide-binding domain-containing protein [Streptosporangiaceae bacterium]